jgi:hypothetical protein
MHPRTAGVDRRQTWRRIPAATIQQFAEAGVRPRAMKAVADGACEYLAPQHRPDDLSGQSEEAPNA